MKFPFKKISFSCVLALVVFAALALTTPAFAEGEAPAADAPPVEAETVEPAAAGPADDSPAEPVEAEMAEALPAEQETTAQPVVEAPVEAPVEVCAGDGSADPYFYDASHTKHGGYGTIQAAVDDFVTLKGTGFIYVEFGTYNAEPSNMVQVYGVNKLTGIVFTDYYASERAPGDSFDPYDSSTWPTVNAMIDIEDQTADFTLLGLRITGSFASDAIVYFENNKGTLNLSYLDIENSGANGMGLEIYGHTGSINLTGVVSHDNKAEGAEIGSGTEIKGKVTVINSAFKNNGQEGLVIYSNALATLTGVTAAYNQSDGASIHTAGVTVKNSVFNYNDLSDADDDGFWYTSTHTGNLTFENVHLLGNHSSGLYAEVNGNVNLTNVRVDGNLGYGAYLDTCDYSGGACQNPGSGNITITKTPFERNATSDAFGDVTGLYIKDAKGSITITKVWVQSNGDGATSSEGAYINNSHSPTKSPVTITSSGFSSNTGSGVTVISLGAITWKDSSASGNTNAVHGAFLDNYETGATAGISLLSSAGGGNGFDGNTASEAGLLVTTSGSIVANSVYASGNTGGYGVELAIMNSASSAAITVNGGAFNDNTDGGLLTFSYGPVTVKLTDGGANNNSGSGACGLLLQNYAAAAPKPVTVEGGTYNGNASNGIQVQTDGLITLKKMDVSWNGSSGVYLNNQNSPTKAGVTVASTMSYSNISFNNNGGAGLYITSAGAITLTQINADQNSGSGAYLANNQTGSTAGVTVTNSHFRTNNSSLSGAGLFIQSYGNVLINNVELSNNGDDDTVGGGASIDNRETVGKAAKIVTITNTTFNDNHGLGLNVASYGKITLNEVDANDNQGTDHDGAHLDNHEAAAPQAVLVNKSNFDRNFHSGLQIQSLGVVTLTYVAVRDNQSGDGVTINNAYGGAVGGVSVSCTAYDCGFQNNGKEDSGDGLTITSYGDIALNGLYIGSNNGNGATLDNSGSIAVRPPGITLTNCYLNDNGNGYGLNASSKGDIKLTNTEVGNNSENGAVLDNAGSATGAGVTITGRAQGDWNWFGNNGSFGMKVLSAGAVTINRISVSDNQFNGLIVDNTASTTAKNVSLSNVEISRNWHAAGADRYGLRIYSKGVISLTDSWVSQNGDSNEDVGVEYNAHLVNSSSLTFAGVNLTNVHCTDAYGYETYAGGGLSILSAGAVTVKNIEAYSNTGIGVKINNAQAGATGGVTFSHIGTYTSWIGNNGDDGLVVDSYGVISISYLNVGDNNCNAGTNNATLNNRLNDSIARLISVSNSRFENASGSGLLIYADAAVTLTNVAANNNQSGGISIRNDYYGDYTVTLTGIQAYVNGSGDGLNVRTSGAVVAKDLKSGLNGASGAVFGDASNPIGSLTMNGTANDFGANGEDGLVIFSTGNVSLTSLATSRNNGSGMVVDVDTGTLTINKAFSEFNGENGFVIYAANTIVLNTIYALSNGFTGNFDGVYVVQTSAAASTTISNGVVHGNFGSGLDIDVNGVSPIITNTTYFGNDVDSSGDLEVYVH